MDITKLPDFWRNFRFTEPDHIGPLHQSGHIDGLADAAKGLEAALPKWTKIIIKDKATWPSNQAKGVVSVMLMTTNGVPVVGQFLKTLEAVEFNQIEFDNWAEVRLMNLTHWRPLCDLDFPPEKGS